MNSDILKGKWNQIKGSAREKWGDLTDDDFARAEGNREQLSGAIQERYGVAKDEAERQIDSFLADHGKTI